MYASKEHRFGKHISVWKLCNQLINIYGGYKKYESVTYAKIGEQRTSYFYLKKLNIHVRASDHILLAQFEKRSYDVEIILSTFNLDFSINGKLYRAPSDGTKLSCKNSIIEALNSLTLK